MIFDISTSKLIEYSFENFRSIRAVNLDLN